LDVLAGIIGWSPQGRRIAIASVEGPGCELIEGRTFVVGEVRDGNLVVTSLDSSKPSDYLLRPRHRGWTAKSLMGTSIAVTVQPLTAAGAGDVIGTAVVRLSRR
jgi:hypothetical protein